MRKLLKTAGLTTLFAMAALAQKQPAPEIRFDAKTPRERQVQLAESAAPAEVSKRATIYVLGEHGYEKAREGTNGFSCLVTRQYVTTMEARMLRRRRQPDHTTGAATDGGTSGTRPVRGGHFR